MNSNLILDALKICWPIVVLMGGFAWYMRDKFERVHVTLAVMVEKFDAHLKLCERHPKK